MVVVAEAAARATGGPLPRHGRPPPPQHQPLGLQRIPAGPLHGRPQSFNSLPPPLPHSRSKHYTILLVAQQV